MLARVIIYTEGHALARRYRSLLDGLDFHVEVVRARDARSWDRLLRKSCDLFVVEAEALPEGFQDSVRVLTSLPESPQVIVHLDTENSETAAELVGAGATAVIHATLGDDLIRDIFAAVLERRQVRATADRAVETGRPRLSDFESRSPRMQAFLEVVQKVTRRDSTLLVVGETGVGKEHLARAIHDESHRSRGVFVSVNCGALPEALLESELFGHEEGAFTGATRARRGLFELAHNGTIFLDEIGEMAHHLQVKLLQVLQTREVRRVGGDHPLAVDVRIIAATNRDLLEEIEAKRFRLDLYYRLSVVTLEIPPLRERREDLPRLTDQLIAHFRQRFPTPVEGVSVRARAALERYSWPGNVRELGNVIERALLLAGSDTIDLTDLPVIISELNGSREAAPVAWAPGVEAPTDWAERTLSEVRQEVLDGFERTYLDAVLRASRGRIGLSAERAGIQPRSLYEKMRRFGLRKEDYRG